MPVEAEVSIRQLPKETEVPEKNSLEAFDKLFYAIAAITRPHTRFGRQRSLAERAERAKIIREIDGANPEKRKQLSDRARALDEVGDQYHQQSEVAVNLPGLGEQKARVVRLVAPEIESLKNKRSKRWVVVAGASNDIDCVGSMVRELAVGGVDVRDITVIGYPESFLGTVTDEFVEAVKSARTYEPHAAFYKKAVEGLMGDDDIQLIGYSNGGPIVELMLGDPKFSSRVQNAVVLCPASSVKQSVPEFVLGCLNEIKTIVKQVRLLPRYTFSEGVKIPNESEILEEGEKLKLLDQKTRLSVQFSRRARIFSGLMQRILYEIPVWRDARVKEGGKLIIMPAREDMITKAITKFNKKTEQELSVFNPQIRVVEIPGTHSSALINPETVVAELNKL